MTGLADALAPLPLIAILRGLVPERAREVGAVLVEAGFRALEVPVNSPDPIRSIALLSGAFGGRALIGAGTVRAPDEVRAVATAGGRMVVMPHWDAAVVAETKRAGLWSVPGVATPSEAFAALAAGADALKMFPAEALPPAVVRAWRAVLPPSCLLLPVGGIRPETLGPYLAAGASGFGIGSALFTPALDDAEIAARARAFAAAWRHAAGGGAP